MSLSISYSWVYSRARLIDYFWFSYKFFLNLLKLGTTNNLPLFMSFQIAFLVKFSITELTSKRFLPNCVYFLVLFQIGSAKESSTTLFTFEWFFARVHDSVAFHVPFIGEFFVANIASVFGLGMYEHMFLKTTIWIYQIKWQDNYSVQ